MPPRPDRDAGGDAEMLAAKAALRDEAWTALHEEKVARFPGAEGRIPNFIGAEDAAERLRGTDAWSGAGTVKSNPDSPQWPVRQRALEDGKVLYMAVPRLAEEKPFFLLDPEQLIDSPRNASSIKGASRSAKTVDVEDLEPVDLVVAGCVAVGKDGARLGKGGGFLLVSLARCGPGYPARGRSLAGELPTLASAHSGRRAAASPSSKACHPGRESRIVREWRASRRAAAGYPGCRASATRKEGLPVT